MVAHSEPLHVYKLICTEDKINEQIVGEKTFLFATYTPFGLWWFIVFNASQQHFNYIVAVSFISGGNHRPVARH